MEAVAAATSTGEIVAAFTRIAASVAAEPPTITISKVALIAACQAWREAHEDHWTKEAGLNFAKALRAFGGRDEVNEAGGDAAVVVEEKEAEAGLQPGELACAPSLTAMVIHLRHEALYHPTYNGTAYTNSPTMQAMTKWGIVFRESRNLLKT